MVRKSIKYVGRYRRWVFRYEFSNWCALIKDGVDIRKESSFGGHPVCLQQDHVGGASALWYKPINSKISHNTTIFSGTIHILNISCCCWGLKINVSIYSCYIDERKWKCEWKRERELIRGNLFLIDKIKSWTRQWKYLKKRKKKNTFWIINYKQKGLFFFGW